MLIGFSCSFVKRFINSLNSSLIFCKLSSYCISFSPLPVFLPFFIFSKTASTLGLTFIILLVWYRYPFNSIFVLIILNSSFLYSIIGNISGIINPI